MLFVLIFLGQRLPKTNETGLQKTKRVALDNISNVYQSSDDVSQVIILIVYLIYYLFCILDYYYLPVYICSRIVDWIIPTLWH